VTTPLRMPVIRPPSPGSATAAYYQGILASTTVRANTFDHDGLRITISNTGYGLLFAMTSGLVTFIPSGQPLFIPGAELSPLPGSLILQIAPTDLNQIRLTPGLPTVARILYLRVDPDSVRRALLPAIQRLNLPLAELMSVWTSPSTPTERAILEDNYLDAIMRGQKSVYVSAGDLIGETNRVTASGSITAGVEFILRFVSSNNADVSPVLYLRGMPAHGYNAPQWLGHPLINAVSNIIVPVNIYLKFEVWNQTSHAFNSLPEGVAIDLMDYDPISNDRIDTQNTDLQGRVHFRIANIGGTGAGEERPDLFFLVHTNGINYAGHTLPREWSTKGWKSTNGCPGYYENFTGALIGDEESPLIFRIGLDFHARIEYQNSSTHNIEHPPKGMLVTIASRSGERTSNVNRGTDNNGEIHAVFFETMPSDTVYLVVNFVIEDNDINLPRAVVHVPITVYSDPEHMGGGGETTQWNSFLLGNDFKCYIDNDRTSIGSQSSPEIFRCTDEYRRAAIFFLKILRELSVFLFYMTNGDWAGVSNLNLYMRSITRTAYSWPVGEVNIPQRDYWNRGTLIHEMSHQIMWQEVNASTLGIAYEGIIGNLCLTHVHDLLANPQHALIEGWAEFMAKLFDGTGPPYRFETLVTDVDSRTSIPLGPPPNNQGESVEGTFANGLLTIFQRYIVTSSISLNAHIPESINGDVTATATWIRNNDITTRFRSMIWQPLKDLRPMSRPTSTVMLNNIRLRNTTVWRQLQAELQVYNMAMSP
jgi:hypothetical protein